MPDYTLSFIDERPELSIVQENIELTLADGGIQGVQGASGTQIHFGLVFPPYQLDNTGEWSYLDESGANTISAAVGDLLIEVRYQDLYELTDTGWVLRFNLVGPQGPEGPQGPVGDSLVIVSDTEPVDPIPNQVWVRPV